VALALCGFLAWSETAQAAEPDLAVARRDFDTLCAPCHGFDAKGHGPASASLHIPPADLTGIAARHGGAFPDEVVFETVSGLSMPDAHGPREMPVWGDVFVSEQVGSAVNVAEALKASEEAASRIEGLVEYLKSLQEVPE
jgi:mono/diheme cytochrome c family protein